MADLRKDVHGPGSLQGVNTVVIAYDNRVAKKDDKITTRYLDVRIHPADRRAAGQTQLALVSKKDDKSPSGYNNSERYSESQFQSIVAAAGDNVTDLTNKDGKVVGKIYGVQSDLLVNASKELVINTKTVEASELSVEPNEAGKDIREQMFDSMKAARDAKAAVVDAPVAEPQAEAPAAEETAEKPAPAKKAPRKRAPAKKAAEAEATVDEPGLG